jgi:hypothetical protein
VKQGRSGEKEEPKTNIMGIFLRISLEVFTFSVASFENDRDGGIFASRK